ncbi:MAG TPA: DUF979 domain-containing protein [Polyangiaceae bacterium]|nr:DUF979 domain-containing protein [Polyangiaceae bacterium]
MIALEHFYRVCGALLFVVAAQALADRGDPKRRTSGAFWGLFGASFAFGKLLPPFAVGLMVLAMAGLAGARLLGGGRVPTTSPEERAALADRFGNRLWGPALTIPAVALVCAVALSKLSLGGRPLLQPGKETIVGLGLAALAALAVASALLRPSPATPLREGRRLLEAIGWAALLPQTLATLGLVFQKAGVGKAVAAAVAGALPGDSRFAAVAVYCVGMAAFTMIMGNAFAAFPVLGAGVALPLLVARGADPAVVAAIGMFSGYCGTLMTPMAANFNLVPAALLELPDQHAVIKAQAPTALLLLGVNVLLMSALAFRGAP